MKNIFLKPKLFIATLILFFSYSCEKENLNEGINLEDNSLIKNSEMNFGSFNDFENLKSLTMDSPLPITYDISEAKVKNSEESIIVDTSRVSMNTYKKNKYYTLSVVDNSGESKSYFENIVIADLATQETKYYICRYYYKDEACNNPEQIDLKNIERGEIRMLNSLENVTQKEYNCYSISTQLCDYGGETHVAGPNCSTTYTRTSNYCISTPDYSSYTTFYYESSGGGSDGGGPGTPAYVDPNDPWTQPISTPQMYAAGLDYHLNITPTQKLWLEQHTTEAVKTMKFLDDNSYSVESKNLAERAIVLMILGKVIDFNNPVANYNFDANNSIILAYELDYKNQMSVQERSIFEGLSRVKQLNYLHSGYLAQKYESIIYGGNFRNTKSDAYRHSLWNAFSTVKLGSSLTNQLTTAHENKPLQYTLEYKENDMDLYNNSKGIEIGLTGSINLMLKVKLAVEEGNLKYLSNLDSNGLATATSVLKPTNQ